jgi:zinc finger-containing ubiquitin peptidase 1
MTREEDPLSCPFCGFKAAEYGLLLVASTASPDFFENCFANLEKHIETYHSEGGSGFVAMNESEASKSEEELYAECPIEGCGEVVAVREMDDHVDFHAQEEDLGGATATAPDVSAAANDERASRGSSSAKSSSSHPDSKRSSRDSKNASAIQSWRQIFSMPSKRPHHSSSPEPSSASQPSRKRRLGKAELGKYAHEKRMPDWLIDLLKKEWGVKASGEGRPSGC